MRARDEDELVRGGEELVGYGEADSYAEKRNVRSVNRGMFGNGGLMIVMRKLKDGKTVGKDMRLIDLLIVVGLFIPRV